MGGGGRAGLVRRVDAERVVAGEVVGVVVHDLADAGDGERAAGIIVPVDRNKHVRMKAPHPLGERGTGGEGGSDRWMEEREGM